MRIFSNLTVNYDSRPLCYVAMKIQRVHFILKYIYHQFIYAADGVSDYRCSNGSCISNSGVCDGWNDCSDGADEAGCGKDQLQFCTVNLTATSPIRSSFKYLFTVFRYHCALHITCSATSIN